MTPMAGNTVMDLLLGQIAPSQSKTASSQLAGQSIDGTGFADLLGMLTGLPNNAAELLSNDAQAFPLADINTAEILNGKDTIDPLVMGALMSNSQARAVTPNIIAFNMGLPLAPLDLTSFVTDTESLPATITLEQTKEPSGNFMQLPKEAILANPQILALLNQTPVDLPTGRFSVLSSKVADGSLQMEVASQETPNQTIKLTIPTALLHQTNSPQSNPAASTAVGIVGQSTLGNRVPLADLFASTERFDQLLTRVNVKEIEIAPSQMSASAGKNPSPVAVAMIAEDNGVPMAISGRMNRDQLVATKQRRAEGSDKIHGDNLPGLSAIDPEDSDVMSGHAKSAAGVTARSDDTLFEALTASTKSSNNNSFTFNSSESSIMLTKGMRHARAMSAETIDRPAVRMTLQQELPNLAQLEGRTLTIKLEPEYLGPARLHLTMRDDTLSARVMVETSSAKSAVESSLSQLTDQLAKAGIKVDYIDVGVRGGGAQNQFFHKQTDWFREQHPRMIQKNDNENVLVESAQPRSDYSRPSYLSADRINIYA